MGRQDLQRNPGGFLLSLLLVACCVACGDSGSTTPEAEPWYPADYMSSYTEVLGCRNPSTEHQLRAIRVHVRPSEAGLYIDSRDSTGAVFPEGTVIIKTEYLDDNCASSPIRRAVMRKRHASSSADISDWEWQVVDNSDRVVEEGQLNDCSSCHTTNTHCGPERDYTCIDFE